MTPGSMPPEFDDGRGGGRADRQFPAGRRRAASARRRCGRCCARANTPRAIPAQNIADLKAQIAACEKGVQELRKMVAHFGLDVVHAYMQHVQDNAEEQVRRVLDVLQRRQLRLRDGRRRVIKVKVSIDKTSRTGIDRLHRHLAAAPEQFQRALGRVHGGGALRLPHAGRRRHPDERRRAEAAQDHHPRRLHAQPELSGGGRRRQCRDVAGHHRYALWRARRARAARRAR